MQEIVLEVWGDFACFCQPYNKVERLSAPFPTPSAAKGILSAIYLKPAEFYYQINRIEVLKPIRYISFKRIRNGKCFHQPCLGIREFVSYFEESDNKRKPIAEDLDAGYMVYDVFSPYDYVVCQKAKPQLSLYHAVMKNGVIHVPPYESPEVLKGGKVC